MAVKLNFSTPVNLIKGIGDVRAAAFKRLGVETAGDLLQFYPRKYEERGKIVKIINAIENELCSVEVTVRETTAPKYLRGNMSVFRSVVEDDTSSMELVFFNTPYVAKSLTKGRKFRAYGRIKNGYYGKEMVSPKLEPITPNNPLPYYVPIYKISPPLNQKTIQASLNEALKLCDFVNEIFPEEIRNEYNLLPRGQAIKLMHYPQTKKDLVLARRTVAFTEMAVFRLALSNMRNSVTKEKSYPLTLKNSGIRHFIENIPFELTNAQKRAIKEIFSDLEKDIPMARLLQGDVGSGKTAVAAAAIYLCVKNGFQACMMAPTEILASQHKKTLDKFLSPFGIKTELLVSGLPAKEKKRVRDGLADGSVNVAVGTHALITDKTIFSNCALAVVDEQHRFGVKQRAELLSKSENNGRRAHILVMSATPIPRSLSLIIFGDLEVSLLDEKPARRKEIITKVVPKDDSLAVYEFIREQIDLGGRAYIVCPLIEENETDLETGNEKRAALNYFKELSETQFKGIPMGLLHGKLKPNEKAMVMEDFSSGKTKILVATTVIEVGVDVPEATVMVIENAECFGLSQLHQLRGRIGRGDKQSYCILINGKSGNETADRLAIMRDTSDGFKVAEADLEKRGPGDFFGERQSGEFSTVFNSVGDITVLAETEGVVKKIKENRENPQYSAIFRAAEKFLERTGGGKTVN